MQKNAMKTFQKFLERLMKVSPSEYQVKMKTTKAEFIDGEWVFETSEFVKEFTEEKYNKRFYLEDIQSFINKIINSEENTKINGVETFDNYVLLMNLKKCNNYLNSYLNSISTFHHTVFFALEQKTVKDSLKSLKDLAISLIGYKILSTLEDSFDNKGVYFSEKASVSPKTRKFYELVDLSSSQRKLSKEEVRQSISLLLGGKLLHLIPKNNIAETVANG